MRASDADRDVVLRTLGEAYAEGRLDRDEHDERVEWVTHAKTLGELPPVLEDLVPSSAVAPYAGLGPLDARAVEEQAVARYEKGRREVSIPDVAALGAFVQRCGGAARPTLQ